jgi:UDP-N-acetylmuramoylalanine--D-glutamate ligase
VSEFRPRVGVLLNLQPDHLDRHDSMEEYRELKSRLFRCMGVGDVGIVHLDEMSAVSELVPGGNRWVSFGKTADADVSYNPNGSVGGFRGLTTVDTPDNEILRVDIAGTGFDNPILGQTAAAAVAVMQACGVSLDVVAERIKAFDSLSHRMQRVGFIDGVLFVNDSKATNLAALKAGLEMSNAPVRLIAGGQLKEKNLIFVKEVLANKAVCVYVIGSAANIFKSCWQDVVVCVHCTDLQTAVRRAWKDAKYGDTVLLSPGCASFDQFKSYKDRGEQFKEIVEKINEEKRDEDSVSG